MSDDEDEKPAKKNECTICKHLSKPTVGKLERAQLFDEVGTPVSINFCRTHSVELFKMGQRKFLVSYHRILNEIISTDETKFLDILEKTIHDSIDEIY